MNRLIANTSQWMNQRRQYRSIRNIIHRLSVKIDQLIHFKLELLTLVSGLEVSETAMVVKFGLMEPDMRDNGRIIELMVKEDLSTWMEMFTKAPG